jgi:A/G-specific adenine glycosylase
VRRPSAEVPAEIPPGALAGAVVRWFRRHRRDLPWRTRPGPRAAGGRGSGGLRRDPYRVWVAEIMLQQTTVKTVVPYYERFLARFPDITVLARARSTSVLAAWSGLGYYRRARHLHEAARLVVRLYSGRLPEDATALAALPGIGRYTQGAILSLAFDRREPILDGNVERVLCRLLGERRDPRSTGVRDRLWTEARRLVEAASSPGDFNEGLMELGATLCTTASPACARCPVATGCRARAQGATGRIPPPRRRPAPVRQKHAVYLVERNGRLLLRRRAAPGLMEGLWEFPGAAPGLDLTPLQPIGAVRHTVMNRRMDVTVRRGRLASEPRGGDYRFFDRAGIERLPISSLVRKILALHDAVATRIDHAG